MSRAYISADSTVHLAEGFQCVRRRLAMGVTRTRMEATGPYHVIVGKLGVTVARAELRTTQQTDDLMDALVRAWTIYGNMCAGLPPMGGEEEGERSDGVME
jgi:hypothetical protein